MAALGLAPANVLQRRRWWQFWKPRNQPAAAAPAAAAPVAAPALVPYQNTSIRIMSPAQVPYPGGNYVADVTQHLDDIQAVVGPAFFAGLAANGKQQSIKYAGANSNQCSGSPFGYTKLRKFHDASQNVQFGAELTATLTSMGHDRPWLVNALRAQGLPRWTNVIDPAPIAPFASVAATDAKVGDWLAGTARPNIDEMDVLMLVVQAGAAPGAGAHSRIDYDPLKLSVATGPRPPQVALFHELCHAYYSAQGQQLGREDSSAEANGGRLFELMAVGLPPFDARPYSENALRAGWAPQVAARPSYP
ncbi:MAG: M91 family zinc metallopeptidase [Solirubrobacteraceae bacterium]